VLVEDKTPLVPSISASTQGLDRFLQSDLPITGYIAPAHHLGECAYFRFPAYNCRVGEAKEKLNIVVANGGCLQPVFENSPNHVPMLLAHGYMAGDGWLKNPYNILGLKSFLVTQNLTTSRLIIWTDLESFHTIEQCMHHAVSQPSELKSRSPDALKCHPVVTSFFQTTYNYTKVAYLNYTKEIQHTPLAESEFFKVETKVMGSMSTGAFSDVVRNLVLHNYGGLWLDHDAIALDDMRPWTFGVGYQFIPAFSMSAHTNGHVLFMYKKSLLAQRILKNLVKFPVVPVPISLLQSAVTDEEMNAFGGVTQDPETGNKMATRLIDRVNTADPFAAAGHWPTRPRTKISGWVYNDALPVLVKDQESDFARRKQRRSWKHGRRSEETNQRDDQTSDTDQGQLASQLSNVQIWSPIMWFDPTWTQCVSSIDGSFQSADQPIAIEDKVDLVYLISRDFDPTLLLPKTTETKPDWTALICQGFPVLHSRYPKMRETMKDGSIVWRLEHTVEKLFDAKFSTNLVQTGHTVSRAPWKLARCT
jgi:hypothetical protein